MCNDFHTLNELIVLVELFYLTVSLTLYGEFIINGIFLTNQINDAVLVEFFLVNLDFWNLRLILHPSVSKYLFLAGIEYSMAVSYNDNLLDILYFIILDI